MKKAILSLLFLLTIQFGHTQCLTTLHSGNYFNFGLKSNGTLWGWGSGGAGQLGNGSESDLLIPTQITTTTNWQRIFCGQYYTFVLKTNGTLWCSGDNTTGQLGIVTPDVYITSFTQMGTATNWKQVSLSTSFTLGVKTDGTLWGWGQNDSYQMGDGTCCSNRFSPGQIGTATDWTYVGSSGTRTGVAIKTNGTLWGWGSNILGILGPSNVSVRQYPTQIGTATDWASISLGNGHILGLKTNGTLWSWGNGVNGQAGDTLPLAWFRDTPVQVGTSSWLYVSAGYNSSYGIKTDGTLWAWGQNDTNQLGDGTTVNRTVPTQIGTDTDWVSVAGGWNHAVALKSNGALFSWGDNYYGQLGNGTNTLSATPVSIPVSGCTLDNEEFETPVMVISPNPVKEALQFNYHGNEVVNGLKVYDMTGKVVYSSNPIASTQFQVTLPLTLPKGFYLLVLQANGRVVSSEKFVKE